MYAFCIGEIKALIHPVWNLSADWSLFSLFQQTKDTGNVQYCQEYILIKEWAPTLLLCTLDIAYKLINDWNLDFNNVVTNLNGMLWYGSGSLLMILWNEFNTWSMKLYNNRKALLILETVYKHWITCGFDFLCVNYSTVPISGHVWSALLVLEVIFKGVFWCVLLELYSASCSLSLHKLRMFSLIVLL